MSNLFKNKKVIFISHSLPKFSEAWMSRITDHFGEAALFVVLSADFLGLRKNGDTDCYSLSKSAFPERINKVLNRRSANDRLLEVIEECDPEVKVVVHFLNNALYLLPAILSNQSIFYVFCHGYDITWDKRSERFPILPTHGFFYILRVKMFIKKTTSLNYIANSNRSKDILVSVGVDSRKVSVNYLSVGSSLVSIDKNFSCDYVEFLFVGRFTDCKGPLETISAFELALQNGLKGRLTMVGDGLLLPQCRELIEASEYSSHFCLFGKADKNEIRELYERSDIFTAHNKYSTVTRQEEAFGVVFIEAMSYGLPVVTGRSGGVAEAVSDNETGFLFEPGNLQEQADYFLKLFTDHKLRERMSKAALRRVQENFLPEHEKARLCEILDVDYS